MGPTRCDILLAQVDFERLRRDCPLPVFIAATHAHTGQLRLFRAHELSAEAVLASACLPNLHRTVLVPFDAPGDDTRAFFNANTLAELHSLEQR